MNKCKIKNKGYKRFNVIQSKWYISTATIDERDFSLTNSLFVREYKENLTRTSPLWILQIIGKTSWENLYFLAHSLMEIDHKHWEERIKIARAHLEKSRSRVTKLEKNIYTTLVYIITKTVLSKWNKIVPINKIREHLI